MTPTATYIAEENCLQELPTMEKPKRPFAGNYSPQESPEFRDDLYHYEANLEIYNAHIATLRKIPCDASCKGLWADQQKVVEGKDYEVREESYCLCHHCNDQGFMTGTEHACRYCNPDGSWRNFSDNYRGRRLVVFPLVPVKREDELWEEVEKLITVNSHWQIPEILRIVKMLKSKYSLTKR